MGGTCLMLAGGSCEMSASSRWMRLAVALEPEPFRLRLRCPPLPSRAFLCFRFLWRAGAPEEEPLVLSLTGSMRSSAKVSWWRRLDYHGRGEVADRSGGTLLRACCPPRAGSARARVARDRRANELRGAEKGWSRVGDRGQGGTWVRCRFGECLGPFAKIEG